MDSVKGRALRIAITAALLSVVLPAAASSGAEPLRQVGWLESGTVSELRRMIVDPGLNLGVTIGDTVENGVGQGPHIIVYDLEKLKIVAKVRDDDGGLTAELATVDERHHRIFFTPKPAFDAQGCTMGPRETSTIKFFDLVTLTWGTFEVPCADLTTSAMPGFDTPARDQFATRGLFYFNPENKLLAIGQGQVDWAIRGLTPLDGDNDKTLPGLYLRQMNGITGALEWEVDLRGTGCDRVVPVAFGAFVARHENNVYSYCYASASGPEGSQGFAVKVPLENERPKPGLDGRPQIILTPTLPNDLVPVLDSRSGRMLYLTSGRANGDAVWVFDPAKERFFGVIASGTRTEDQGTLTYVGMNGYTGRAYLLTSAGFLVADARHDPLPAGLSYPLLTNLRGQGSGPMIAVAPKLRRLFVPVQGHKFAVLQDDVPEPEPVAPLDPDTGTADIVETPGKTGSVFGGAGAAFGGRILITGGVPRLVNNSDPTCFNVLISPRVRDAQGRCLAEQFVTAGNRDLYIAPSQVEMGSETGVAAAASGAAFATHDTATDADMKQLGGCYADMANARSGHRPPAEYDEFCASTPLGSFGSGTRGPAGKGYPFPGSYCEDFGTGSMTDTQRPGTERFPQGMFSASAVRCDSGGSEVRASSQAAAFALPDVANPSISVGRMWSEVSTTKTPGGIVTSVTATATAVQIGGVAIGKITTSVVTKAHGRTGTTAATLTRTFEDVTGNGVSCKVCSADDVVNAVNQALGLRAKASVPEHFELKSPRGYQGVVVKDPALRASERAVNNDESYAVPGLQIVFYNDGADGRNRLVLQLAAVQAESRYGIFVLPEAADGIEETIDIDVVTDLAEGALTLGTQSGGPLAKVVNTVRRAAKTVVAGVQDTLRLIVHDPGEFAILFVMWSLIAMPVYLGIRRFALRQFVS